MLMKTNYVIICGDKYYVPDEVINTIKANFPRDPFIPTEGQPFYHITGNFKVGETAFHNNLDEYVRKANCFLDEDMAKQRAMHEELNRLLWQYSIRCGGDDVWNDTARHWHIYQNINTDTFNVSWTDNMYEPGVTYFADSESAKSAIKEVIEPYLNAHPNFELFKGEM
jgi:hypothetical protein